MLRMRGNRITWLGHATFRIVTTSGRVILIDPWLSTNPACPEPLKTPDRVDLMFITHGHSDHIGDVVSLAKQFKPDIVGIVEMSAWLASKGVEKAQGMNKGGTVTVGDVAATMVQAVHSGGIDDDGKMVYGGEPAGFVIRLPGGMTVYHAGDTAVFGDMKIIGDLYAPELALLPIGDYYTMSPREAALAIRLLGVKHVVPMHYGTFPVLTGRPETLRELTQDIAGLEIHALKAGESLE
ncbi:MAG: metal-dependent hydrolase [Candidatus Acidiferrales bacterium]|jgi:L-ascorbate metabolism protein UlaG (beta-lactamase superfamily)